jgi:hypothetical protein
MQKRNLAIRLNYWQHLTQPLSLYQHISCQISHQQHYYIVNFQETAPILIISRKKSHLMLVFDVILETIHQNSSISHLTHLMLLGQVFILILAI